MTILWIFALILCSLYVISFLFFIYGWKQLPHSSNQVKPSRVWPTLSIIAPLRNEDAQLPDLLNDIHNQTYPSKKYEIILVNDHSTDQTGKRIEQAAFHHDHIMAVHLPKDLSGKKYAIQQGAEKASGELLITIDGDIRVGRNWLTRIAEFYNQTQPDMIIAPVLTQDQSDFFTIFQTLEMMALMVVAAGSAGIKRPILCNGANLIFTQEAYQRYPLDNRYSSGDDIFFLLHLKKDPNRKIAFLKSHEAVAWTKPAQNISQFIRQRQRWTSKYKGYKDSHILLAAIIIFLMNALLFIYLMVSLITKQAFGQFLFVLLIKTLADFFLLWPAANYLNKKYILPYLIPGEFLYFLYVTLTGILANIRSYKWKGRIVR